MEYVDKISYRGMGKAFFQSYILTAYPASITLKMSESVQYSQAPFIKAPLVKPVNKNHIISSRFM